MFTQTKFAITVTLLAVGMLALGGCASQSSEPGMATSSEDVVGMWRAAHGQAYIEFTEDGQLRTDRFGMYGSLEGEPNRTNEVWFEGEQSFVKELSTHGVASCEGVVGVYEIALLADGNINFNLVEDDCEERVEILMTDPYERFEREG